MNRSSLLLRQRKILELLEIRAQMRRRLPRGEWVPGPDIAKMAGSRFSIGINEMAPLKPPRTKTPNNALGFKIGRRKMEDGSGEWKYRLEAYPPGWDGKAVDLGHADPQIALFPAA